MQPRGELACARADEPPSPPAERLSAGRQLNAVFALALLAAPPVRGCPMKADMALFLAEARFKADGGGAGASDRPSQSPGDQSALLQPPRLEETRKVKGETILNCRSPSRSSASVASHADAPLQDFPKFCVKLPTSCHYDALIAWASSLRNAPVEVRDNLPGHPRRRGGITSNIPLFQLRPHSNADAED